MNWPADDQALPPAKQEVEVWWGGCAARSMLPSLLVCVLLTAGIIGAASYLGIERIVPAGVARWLVYGLSAALWLVEFGCWGYRLIGYNYRLTTRRVFCDWGFLFPPSPPVELTQIKSVRVEQTAWERGLNVGRIVIEANPTSLVLPGVGYPQVIAAEIEMYARHAR